MLITVEDYTWRQTEEIVVIRVPLKGIHYSKADIFTSERYLKAHYQPFLFEVFLLHPVQESESKCTLTEEEIIFELVKPEIVTWERLNDDTISKKDAIALKQKIIEETQVKLQAVDEKRSKQRQELSRVAVRRQMGLDAERLKEIDKLRNAERNKAMSELEKWKKSSSKTKAKNYLSTINNSKVAEIDENVPASGENESNQGKITEIENEAHIKKIIELEDKSENKQAESKAKKIPFRPDKKQVQKQKTEDVPVPVPLPRKPASITVSFTERVFPTPLRESKNEEEQEWLKKQAEARRCAGFDAADLRPEEKDPQWLKDKGDTFFRQNNYLAAVSAYSHGLKLSPKFPALYVNRSAAQFALGNLHKTIEDCSTALELLTPPVAANLESRAKCFARRGAAFCRLGIPSRGVPEFQAALKLQPNNDSLKEDLQRAQLAVKAENTHDGDELYISKH